MGGLGMLWGCCGWVQADGVQGRGQAVGAKAKGGDVKRGYRWGDRRGVVVGGGVVLVVNGVLLLAVAS